jgi:hypothetical protein
VKAICKILGIALIVAPVGAALIGYVVAMIELPPVLWATVVVGTGYAMIATGNWLIKYQEN